MTLLLDLGSESGKLAGVDQELPSALGVVPGNRPEGIRGDVKVNQPQLVAVDPGEGLVERGVPIAKTLDLRSHKDDPALDRLEDFVTKRRLSVTTRGIVGWALL